MDMKRAYYEGIDLLKSKTVFVWSKLFLVFLAILPKLIN